MAITVNDREFVTLDDAFYINGARVIEARLGDGRLVYPRDRKPYGIRIIRPPYRKLYSPGDDLSFDGIAVVLLDKHGKVFEDKRYPNGVIPFDELIFPVTKAETDAYKASHSDGNGINARMISCNFECLYFNTRYQQWIPWAYVYPGGLGFGSPSASGHGARISLRMDAPSIVMLTRYNDGVYAALVSGNNKFDLAFENPSDPYGWGAYGGTIYRTSPKIFTWAAWHEEITEVPTSTVNPAGRNIDDLEPVPTEIPVQWKSIYDGQVFEDTFEITIDA